jgi:hypothetical protein
LKIHFNITLGWNSKLQNVEESGSSGVWPVSLGYFQHFKGSECLHLHAFRPRTILRWLNLEERSMIDWNVRHYILNNTVSHLKWLKPQLQHCEPWISLATHITLKVYFSVMSINVYLTGLK